MTPRMVVARPKTRGTMVVDGSDAMAGAARLKTQELDEELVMRNEFKNYQLPSEVFIDLPPPEGGAFSFLICPYLRSMPSWTRQTG
jgi:hypothetical protein